MSNNHPCSRCNDKGTYLDYGNRLRFCICNPVSQDVITGGPYSPLQIMKVHPDAVMPQYARSGDAGLDLVAIDNGVTTPVKEGPTGDAFYRYAYYREYRTGLAMAIPHGHVGLIFPRSSISNTALALSNAVGVIDSGYRGEVKFRFRELLNPGIRYKKGDKIGQLIVMPYPEMYVTEVTSLDETDRGSGGFGSSGQ